jgi:hypothetical protein
MAMAAPGWHKFKRELVVGIGSTFFLLGVFAAILLVISRMEHQKALWVIVSIACALLGWFTVRTQTKGFVETFKIMIGQLLSAIFSPVNWFNW